MDATFETLTQYGAAGLFVILVLCSFGFPMAKSLVIVFGGVLAGMGRGNPVVLFLGCSLGLHGGDFSLFLIGRRWGEGFCQVPLVRRVLSEKKMNKARTFVQRHGTTSILLARITPVIRSACYLIMGSLRMSPLRFSIINYGVAVVYSGIFFGIGLLLGNNRDRMADLVRNGNIIFAIAVASIAIGLLVIRSRRTVVHPGELPQE